MVEEQKSLWENIDENMNQRAKVVFDINIPQTVEFPEDFVKPDEYPGEHGPFCVFKVKHEGEEADIRTSAFTLLAALKKLMPLAGKKVSIVKKLEKGKSRFVVDEVNKANIREVSTQTV